MADPITWDRPKLERFKRALAAHFDQGGDRESTFTFEGHEFVAGYAYYLIEYLSRELS